MTKQRKRANGTGSTWFDPKRDRYVGQITVYADGRTKRRTVMARTQDELAERLAALRTAANASPELPAGMTVSAWCTHWLDNVLPNGRNRPTTVDNYANVIRRYVDPTVGRVELAKLTPDDVDRMGATLAKRGLSPNTRRLARTVLRRALKRAERSGLVTSNAAALTDGIAVPRPHKRAMTPDQARALLAHAHAEGHGALVTVLLGLGLRRAEALGLRWSDINMDATRPTLTINGELTKDTRGATTWQPVTKTSGSRRTLTLPATVAAVLRAHHATQAAERLAYGPGWGREHGADFVFTSSVGTPMDLDRVTRLVTRLAAAAGLGHWTPHGLRHSAASILIASGTVDLKQVSELLGHTSIRVTADIYGHLFPEAFDHAASSMETALWG